jgi:hypothetical protein
MFLFSLLFSSYWEPINHDWKKTSLDGVLFPHTTQTWLSEWNIPDIFLMKQSKRSKSSWSSSSMQSWSNCPSNRNYELSRPPLISSVIVQRSTLSTHPTYTYSSCSPDDYPNQFPCTFQVSQKHSHVQSCVFPVVPSQNQFPQDSSPQYPSNSHTPQTCTLAVSGAHFFPEKCLFVTNPHTYVVPPLLHLIQKISQQLGWNLCIWSQQLGWWTWILKKCLHLSG